MGVDNVLTWERASLIASLMDEYDINLAAIIQYEFCERAFGETMTLLFPCIIQRLCNNDSVTKVSEVDEGVIEIARAQTKLMKDLTCASIIVPLPSLRAHQYL